MKYPSLVFFLLWSIFFPAIGQAEEVTEEVERSETEQILQEQTDKYLVGYGDTISIEVWAGQEAQETLSGTYFVFSSGNIEMPLLGKVFVRDLSLESITDFLTATLSSNYIKEPHVTVQIENYGSQAVHVLGAVETPGSFPLHGPMSLAEAIAKAHGTNRDEKGAKEAKIIRENEEMLIVNLNSLFLEGQRNIPLRAGDVIYVTEGQFIVVNGKVKKPGTIPWREGMTITEAIAEAGGALKEANTREVYIIRDEKRIPVNVKRILQGRLPDMVVQHGDKVFLEESFW